MTLSPTIRVLGDRIIAIGTGANFPKLSESKVLRGAIAAKESQ